MKLILFLHVLVYSESHTRNVKDKKKMWKISPSRNIRFPLLCYDELETQTLGRGVQEMMREQRECMWKEKREKLNDKMRRMSNKESSSLLYDVRKAVLLVKKSILRK